MSTPENDPVPGGSTVAPNIVQGVNAGTAERLATAQKQDEQTTEIGSIDDDTTTLAACVGQAMPIEPFSGVSVRIGNSITLTTQPSPSFTATAPSAGTATPNGTYVYLAGVDRIEQVGESSIWTLATTNYKGGDWSVDQGAPAGIDKAWPTILSDGVKQTGTRSNPLEMRLPAQDGFGRSMFVEPTPAVQATTANGMKYPIWESYTFSTGTVTTTTESDGLGYVRTGANPLGIAERRSLSSFTYRAGQSFAVEFTTVFSAPAVGGILAVGGGSSDAVAVGYNGLDFGFWIFSGGMSERRILTITTASTTAENVTVTLNGVATLVAVTNSGNTVTTAREIAAGNYSASGLGWDAYQLGSTVIFVAKRPGPLSGAYTLTATTAIGAFSVQHAGVVPTQSWYPQSGWTGDKLDGTGATGVTIDPTKGQIWSVVVPHLGFGAITLHWFDDESETWILCNKVRFANISTTPNLANPTLRLWLYAAGAANIYAATRSMRIVCHGKIQRTGRNLNIPTATKTSVGTTPVPVLSVRNERYDNGNANRSPYKPTIVMFTANATGEVSISAVVNPTLTGSNFQPHPADPVLAVDTSATASTGGIPLGSLCTSRNGSGVPIDVSNIGLALPPGYVVTFLASQNTGAAATVLVALNGYLDEGSGSEN